MSRPPAKPHALILTAGYGEGHNAAARNLQQALQERGVHVAVGDFFQDCYGPVDDLFRWLYQKAINQAPVFWELFYQGLDRGGVFRKVSWPVMHRLERELAAWIRRARPDLVVSTHPAYPLALQHAFGPNPPFYQAVVVTDSISINSLWHAGNPRKYYVANEATREVLLKRGVEGRQVEVRGFPVPLEMAGTMVDLTVPTPEQARLLLMVNSTRRDALDTMELLARETPWHLTVAVGRHAELQRRAQKAMAGAGPRVQVLGWTRLIPQLLLTHHLVVSKAGGATTQEAIAACCPLVISQIVPGQEEGNAELVERLGVGLVAERPRDILQGVRAALGQDAARWRQWRQKLREVARPDAARDIAGDLLESAGLDG